MNDSKHWTVPKWPFLLGDALLLGVAYWLIRQAPHPIGRWEIVTAAACVALGAVLGALPFILDYRAIVKVIDAGALGAISEKIQGLEKLAAQIGAATNEWLNVQTQAEKISNGANEIADKMAGEIRQFTEFMQNMNDNEKGRTPAGSRKAASRRSRVATDARARPRPHFCVARRRLALRPAKTRGANHAIPKRLPRRGAPHRPRGVRARARRTV